MTTTTTLADPDEVRENERGFTARWTHVCELPPEHEGDTEPRFANVVLSVSHHKAGVSYWHGTRHGAYIGASLSNESEQGPMRGTKISFATNSSVSLAAEAAPRMNRKRVREVLGEAIAEVKRLHAAGDERVLGLWQGVGC